MGPQSEGTCSKRFEWGAVAVIRVIRRWIQSRRVLSPLHPFIPSPSTSLLNPILQHVHPPTPLPTSAINMCVEVIYLGHLVSVINRL